LITINFNLKTIQIMKTLNLTVLQKMMLKALIFFVLLFSIAIVSAQDRFKIQNDTIVSVNKESKRKTPPKLTKYVIVKSDSTYQVWKGLKGGYFINRKSKKSGKMYKQYIKLEN